MGACASAEIIDAVVVDHSMPTGCDSPKFEPLEVYEMDQWTSAISAKIAEYILKYVVPFWNNIPINTIVSIGHVHFTFGAGAINIIREFDISITVYWSGRLVLGRHTQKINVVVEMINLIAHHIYSCGHKTMSPPMARSPLCDEQKGTTQ